MPVHHHLWPFGHKVLRLVSSDVIEGNLEFLTKGEAALSISLAIKPDSPTTSSTKSACSTDFI